MDTTSRATTPEVGQGDRERDDVPTRHGAARTPRKGRQQRHHGHSGNRVDGVATGASAGRNTEVRGVSLFRSQVLSLLEGDRPRHVLIPAAINFDPCN